MITLLVHTVGAADLSALLTIKSLVACLMYVDNHIKINKISLHVVTKTEKEGGVEKPNSKVEKQQQSSYKNMGNARKKCRALHNMGNMLE